MVCMGKKEHITKGHKGHITDKTDGGSSGILLEEEEEEINLAGLM